MNEIINFLTSSNVLGLIILLVVFLLSIFFFLRSIVGFIIGLIFLAIALVSGNLLLHNELVRSYVMREESHQNREQKPEQQIERERKKEEIKDQTIKIYDDFMEWLNKIWEGVKTEGKKIEDRKSENKDN